MASKAKDILLYVGLNYTGDPDAELQKCQEDAEEMADEFSRRRWAVAGLLGAAADRSAILGALEAVVRDARPGDRVALSYSGHGALVPDHDNDELTAHDQALVPADYRQGRFITDDDLRTVLQKLRPGVNFQAFLDCCYSATMTRLFGADAAASPEQSGPPPVRRAKYLVLNENTRERHLAVRGQLSAPPTPLLFTPDKMLWAAFGACQESEVAYETTELGGVFTHHLLKVLRESGSGISRQSLLDRIILSMGPRRWQTPNLDTSLVGRKQRVWWRV